MDRGERIRRLREAKGWTQAHLAAKVARETGVTLHTSYLSKIERGKAQNVGVQVLDAIAVALEVPLSAVYADDHDSEIQKDSVGFVTSQCLEVLIAKEKISDYDAGALRAKCRDVGGPTTVEEWRKLLSYLSAYKAPQPKARRQGKGK